MRKLLVSICLLLFLPSTTDFISSSDDSSTDFISSSEDCEDCTTVFIYDSVTDSSANTTSWLTSPKSSSISDLSFCLWIKLYFLVANRVIHYPLNDNKGFRLTLQQNYGFLK